MAFGEAEFCRAAAAAGVDGLIVPDIPSDEAGPLLAACTDNGLDARAAARAHHSDARIELACRNAGGFVYLVSVVGTTGAREQLGDRVAGLITRTRVHTALPLLVGFGISTPAHVTAALAAGADGVVIGSRAIDVVDAGGAGRPVRRSSAELHRRCTDQNPSPMLRR